MQAAALGPLLDVACGRGRHLRWLAGLGLPAVGVDRSADALAALPGLPRVRADLEAPSAAGDGGWPFAPARFGAVLVFRYLHRPLAATLAAALRPGGLLVYETFTERQRELAPHPRNPAFLLAAGELPRLFPGLVALDYEEGVFADPEPTALARLVARRPL